MNILIPMAGAGSRFSKEGYKVHKPIIPVTYHKTGEKMPMVVASALDLPDILESKLTFIDRDFHKKDGVEEKIKSFFPKSKFITIDHLTQGQASTCMLAKEFINNDEDLLIAGCDNGMVFDKKKFDEAKNNADVLVFTFRFNEVVLESPKSYGWVNVDEFNIAKSISVKLPISDNPLKDHAVVSTFWFKMGRDFVKNAELMIDQDERVNNEFYADSVIKYCISSGLKVMVFEIERYLGFGTPRDLETYEKTINYWRKFYEKEVIDNSSLLQ